jgi:hypothetical protein
MIAPVANPHKAAAPDGADGAMRRQQSDRRRADRPSTP